MATSLHPPFCSPGLPTDDNITHLDEDIKSAAIRFTTVTEILNALMPLRLELIGALKPALMFNISDGPKTDRPVKCLIWCLGWGLHCRGGKEALTLSP